MPYIENSETITGYRVKMMYKPAFRVTGFTLIVPPQKVSLVPEFWSTLIADGRLEQLRESSSIRPWVLGLGSWDPECQKHGSRYTICLEETAYTDFSGLAQQYTLFTKQIGESDWMCFELDAQAAYEKFWQDNPYKMMGPLGYDFHTGSFDVGLHFDAYPPTYQPEANPAFEFWITVKKRLKAG